MQELPFHILQVVITHFPRKKKVPNCISTQSTQLLHRIFKTWNRKVTISIYRDQLQLLSIPKIPRNRPGTAYDNGEVEILRDFLLEDYGFEFFFILIFMVEVQGDIWWFWKSEWFNGGFWGNGFESLEGIVCWSPCWRKVRVWSCVYCHFHHYCKWYEFSKRRQRLHLRRRRREAAETAGNLPLAADYGGNELPAAVHGGDDGWGRWRRPLQKGYVSLREAGQVQGVGLGFIFFIGGPN